MTALKKVFGSISALWNKPESDTQSSPLALERKSQNHAYPKLEDQDLIFDFSTNVIDEDRRETGEDEFSVDYELEEYLIRTSARQQGYKNFNFEEIKSTNNEYRYLTAGVPVDMQDQIYSFVDKNQLLFIDSKRICLANPFKQTIDQMFFKRDVEKISILSHTVAVRRHKQDSKCPADLMLLDLRRFQDLVPYLQLFYTNLL